MKERNKSLLLAFAASGIVTLGVIGSTTGTIAWYAYSASVKISYVGTSVKKSEILSVGLVDDLSYIDNDHLVQFNLTRENMIENEGLPNEKVHSIVWTNSSTGFPLEAIREYLYHSPYGVDELSPVSSLSRALDSNDDFKLYRSPDYGDEVVTKETKKEEYVVLPFAYKVTGSDDQLVANHDIWLTDVSVQAAGGVHVDEAVRVFVQNDTRKFIFKPADTTTNNSGSTRIGGLLDLDGDGTYDYNKQSGNEYVYGDYTVNRNTITYSDDPYGQPWASADYDNVNHTPYEEQSTFYAKHGEAALTAIYDESKFGVAEYYTFHKIKPGKNASGDFYEGDTGIKMATTNVLTDKGHIGFATFTIYLEGWDHAVTDVEVGHSFNLGLQFEVNRL